MARPTAGFELREHTADIALYVWAKSAEALFATAAEGFYAAIGELAVTGGGEPFELELTAPDQTDLLGDFLAELLFLFDTRRLRLADLDIIELAESKLRLRGTLQPIDMARSTFDLDIKAVTRHNLSIDTTDRGLESTIILDI
jgi:SHS2 domain-containing protein